MIKRSLILHKRHIDVIVHTENCHMSDALKKRSPKTNQHKRELPITVSTQSLPQCQVVEVLYEALVVVGVVVDGGVYNTQGGGTWG